MKTNGIGGLRVGDLRAGASGELVCKTSRNAGSQLKKGKVLDTLKAILANDELAEACFAQLYGKRVFTKDVLYRIQEKIEIDESAQRD